MGYKYELEIMVPICNIEVLIVSMYTLARVREKWHNISNFAFVQHSTGFETKDLVAAHRTLCVVQSGL